MPTINGNKLTLYFGERPIFNEADFTIADNTINALVGSNGSGKSTLLKSLANIQELDSGSFEYNKNTKIAYLPQDNLVHSGNTLYKEVEKTYDYLLPIIHEKFELEHKLSSLSQDDSYNSLVNRHHELSEIIINSSYYDREKLIYRVLLGLGFSLEELEKEASVFSGGYQMRIALAKILLGDNNVLLLDEPTNYLDLEARLFLQHFLLNQNKTVLVVSHDKGFLDSTVTNVFEIANAKITKYSGNYSFYVKEKEIRRAEKENELRKQQLYIEKNEAFIEKFRSKATKSRQVQSRIKAIEKLDKIELDSFNRTSNIYFPPAPNVSNKVLEFENVGKHFGNNTIFNSLDMILAKGQRLAIVGKNGLGKSTILKLITGDEKPSSGTIKYANNIKIGYFSQSTEEALNPNNTLIEELEEVADTKDIPKLRNLLGGFLFSNDDIYKKISVLSGGERSRLALAKILLHPSNLLILDEPTNHLDMETKEKLIKAIERYDGTLIIVSHDTEVLKRLSENILYLSENNEPEYIYGGYSYFEYRIDNKYLCEDTNEKKEVVETISETKLDYQEQKKLRNRVSVLERTIKNCENKIENIENELEKIKNLMALSENYSDVTKFKKLSDKERELNFQMEEIEEEYFEYFSELENLNAK